MAKILETNLCRINYSDSLEELSNATVKLLQNKIVEYKKLFNIEFDEQIIVNYFDDLEEFREFIYKIRGERVSLPKYAKGTYDDGMVNACIEPDTQLKRLYTASHELFHILYMKYILKITLKNDALNSLYARYGNLCHLLLGVSLFLILYVIYKKFLQHISGIAHILKLSDKYSYDIYLAHHIYILGPLSILSLQISAFSKIIILIGLISAQSIIVHKASALLNQLKISD